MISLGIDIGGTGCKCVAFRDDGAQLAIAYTEYPLASGSASLPPDVLTSSVFQVIARCTAQLEDRYEITSITASSFGESFVAVDELGNALTDILLYFGNTQSEEFSRLIERVGQERFMQIARILPDASYSLSKMLYTQKVAERPVWKFLFIAGFICYKLSVEEQEILLGIRPEHITLEDTGVDATIDVSEMTGSSVHLHVTAGGKDVVIVVSTMDMTGAQVAALKGGVSVKFNYGGNNCHVFSKETGTNLEATV